MTYILLQRHLDGVVSVHFKEAEEADSCVQNLHQRWFAQRRVLAETWDGKTKYEVLETEEEREARLKKWEKYLETGEHAQETKPGSSTGVSVDLARDSQSSGERVAPSTATDSVSKETVNEQNSVDSDKSAVTSDTSANPRTEIVSSSKPAGNNSDVERNPFETGTSSSAESNLSGTSSAVNTNGVDQSAESTVQNKEENDMEVEDVNR